MTRVSPRSRSRKLCFAAAAALVACAGSAALAQQRVNARGDALDSNNRVGDSRSYGVPTRDVNDRFRLNNAVVTGDVTGGRGFRGFVPYRNERSFHDFSAGQFTDNFIGRSSGASAGGTVINNAQLLRPYYGSSQITGSRQDLTRIPGTGGYIPTSALQGPAPTSAGRTTALDARLNLRVSRDVGDRLGDDSGETYWDRLGDSPILSPATRDMASRARVLSPFTTLSRDARLEPLTSERLNELRDELVRDAAILPEDPQAREQAGGLRPAEGAGAIGDRTAMGDRRTDSQAEGGAPLQPLAEGARQRLDESLQRSQEVRLADPAEQSSQYAQLRDRLERLQDSGVLDSQRPVGAPRPDGAVPTPQPTPEVEPAQTPETAPQQQPGEAPGVPQVIPPRAYPLPGAATRPATPQPVVITSFAEGVTSSSLRRMYEEAEVLMKEGRYVSAIARYDAAERLVPNQPLNLLGRSAAELGAGYYRRCAQTLELAFKGSPELMMARLDLPALIGQKRLDEVVQTLQERLAANAEDPDPAFLLGFIAYHSGDNAEAARLLGIAAERSSLPFYGDVRAHWGVAADAPSTQPAGE